MEWSRRLRTGPGHRRAHARGPRDGPRLLRRGRGGGVHPRGGAKRHATSPPGLTSWSGASATGRRSTTSRPVAPRSSRPSTCAASPCSRSAAGAARSPARSPKPARASWRSRARSTRARITAARSRGLQGVDVVCDDFRDFLPPAAFDAVFLIGVLEYAPSLLHRRRPRRRRARQSAGSASRADGAVVVAIENQFGLKYLAGARRGPPRTAPSSASRTATRRRSARAPSVATSSVAGSPAPASHSSAWYYPFPDYKLPR